MLVVLYAVLESILVYIVNGDPFGYGALLEQPRYEVQPIAYGSYVFP